MEGDSAHRSALRKAAFFPGQGELEIPHGGAVEDHEFPGVIGSDLRNMGEVCLLCFEKVGKKRSGSTDPAGKIRDPKTLQGTDMKMIEDRRPA